jgi:hypothetical protein
MNQREAMFSDGPIEGFIGGWAKIPFCGRLVHHWKRDELAGIHRGGRAYFWVSLCGVVGLTHVGVPALGGGNFPHCKRCTAKASK